MLSGIRFVSREEANLESQHRERENKHKSRRHGKEKKLKKKYYKEKRASKNGDFSDSSSSNSRDSNEPAGNQDKNQEEPSTRKMESSTAFRKAVGLEWMVQAPPPSLGIAEPEEKRVSEERNSEENSQLNPKEMNPFLKNGGDGYPLESWPLESRRVHAPVVGDGGLSWRLKALKRAKEQAEREGRKLDQVVEERWGSLAEMTVSVSAKRAAHAHAHLHAIKERKNRENMKSGERNTETNTSQDTVIDGERVMETLSRSGRDDLKDAHGLGMRMKAPRATASLHWKRRKDEFAQSMRAEDKGIFNAAASALNRFQNDGSFLQNFDELQQDKGRTKEQENAVSVSDKPKYDDNNVEGLLTSAPTDIAATAPSEGLSANQLAAKALQLQMQGKVRKAEDLLSELQRIRENSEEFSALKAKDKASGNRHEEANTGYKETLKSVMGSYKQRKDKNESADLGLVKSILSNKQYNRSSCVDDEYESVNGTRNEPERKAAKRKASMAAEARETKQAVQAHKRIITQEERCQFCFNNHSRPKHLTISIANSCYLMLPPWEPIVDGHCLIVPTQHEGSSRNIDDDVWEEIRNYKKCLLQMFAKQGRGVLFLETVLNLSQQRRHCLIECIPVPQDKAKQAPLYFKKAIDEAEDEWSQHDAKKLIDTSLKGLRGSIPKNFPYFHVEFGLNGGYVHVIDNEKEFKRDFGINVVIGMLKLPEEEMHRRRKQLTFDQQRVASLDFRKSWAPFDWTTMLD